MESDYPPTTPAALRLNPTARVDAKVQNSEVKA